MFQIITSLWGQSTLDNFSEFQQVTMIITDFILRYHTGEFEYNFVAWNKK